MLNCLRILLRDKGLLAVGRCIPYKAIGTSFEYIRKQVLWKELIVVELFGVDF
jgi:hypothetical protein